MNRPALSGIDIRLAKTAEDRRAALRLRYDVFIKELGGNGAGVDHEDRIEADLYDEYADHILAIETTTGQVVGTYRLILPEVAERCGGYYSAPEFDLSKLEKSGKRLLELGRTCLHRDFRGGSVLAALWNGLADYVRDNDVDLLFGVASFHGTELSKLLPALSLLHHRHLAPEPLRAVSRCKTFDPRDLITPENLDRKEAMLAVPGLIKAYLRAGGMIGQGAFVDHAFNTTDVCVILEADAARLSSPTMQIGR